MQLYEVSFPLESGYTLNMLMAAPNEDDAKREAGKVLRDAAEPRKVGDVIRFCWSPEEVTAKPVTLAA